MMLSCRWPERLPPMTGKTTQKELALISAITLGILLCLFGLLETALAFWYPRSYSFTLPPSIVKGLRHYYSSYDRQIIQYRPDYAQYDKDLFYTLKPGEFRFTGREFDAPFSVNHLGLRDDEESLHAPEVIVLGDSYAMGWGVEQERTFAERLAAKTGKKVLNTGISSYGTAREMILLRKLDLSKLNYLIIQYGANDYDENKAFREHNNVLPISSPEEYQRLCRQETCRADYYWGKLTLRLFPSLLRHPIKASSWFQRLDPKEPSPEYGDEVDLFLNALAHSGVNLEGVHLLVFETNVFDHNDPVFIQALEQRYQANPASLPAGIASLSVIDFSRQWDNGHDFFVLDDHLTEAGHEKIAQTLATLIQHKE